MNDIIRKFETKHFRVIVRAEEEYDLDLSFDDTGEITRGLETGKYVAFCAHAFVVFKPTGTVLADDFLGNCIYESFESFMDHKECGQQNREYAAQGINGRIGSYFTQMVANVCAEARNQFKQMQDSICSIRLR